jgi:hypothetical protein
MLLTLYQLSCVLVDQPSLPRMAVFDYLIPINLSRFPVDYLIPFSLSPLLP